MTRVSQILEQVRQLSPADWLKCTLDETADVTLSADEQRGLWQQWIEGGPQGPIEEEEPELP
ncbi:MAG: hypothetical protein DMG07_28960, partial [Acidobacteria bacterium]